MLSAAVCIIGPDPKNALFRNHHHHIFLTFWQLKKKINKSMLKLFLKSIDLKTGKHHIIEQSRFCTGAKINRRTKNRQK